MDYSMCRWNIFVDILDSEWMLNSEVHIFISTKSWIEIFSLYLEMSILFFFFLFFFDKLLHFL